MFNIQRSTSNVRFIPRGLLLIIFSLLFSPAGAQLTLERAIRLAQDSTIAVFESRHEQEYRTQHYDEFMALRKPQLNLRVAPNYYKYIADLSSDYVDVDNYHNLSAAASVTLTQKMLDWGGEAYVGTRAIWSEYFSSDKLYARRFVAAPLMLGYRQTLLGYNPYRWEKAIEDQRLKAAQQQHDYDMNQIAEETVRRFFKLVCAKGELEMFQRNAQVTDTLYAIAREKASIAMVTVAELRSLELDRANAANELMMALTAEEVARVSLASYLMLSNDSVGIPSFNYESAILSLDAKPVGMSVDEAIGRAMENSPALQHQLTLVTESRQQEQKARKEKGVNVALDVNVGMQQMDENLGTAYRNQRLYAIGAVTFSVPLMDHGAAKKRHAAAQALVKREESALDEARRALREEVTTTLQDVSTYYLLLERTHKAVTDADEVYEMIADNYANGLCDMNTYALAEKRRNSAYQHYLRSLEKYWTTYYHLKTLIGS